MRLQLPLLAAAVALSVLSSTRAQTPAPATTPTPSQPPAQQTPPSNDPTKETAPAQPATAPATPPPATPPPGATPAAATPAATTPPPIQQNGVEQIIKDLESKGSSRPPVHAATPTNSSPNGNGAKGRADDRDRPMTAEQRAIASGKLLREGSFIVSRRARMVRVREGSGWALMFDNTAAPTPASAVPAVAASTPTTPPVSGPVPVIPTPDVPMILQPCMKVGEMERFAQQYGDAITFTVSGQVFVFKGRNYLLPSVAIADRVDSNLGR